MSRSELLGVFLAGLCLLSLSASAETYDSSGGKFELETSVGAIAHAWSPVKHRLPLYGGFEKTNFAYGSVGAGAKRRGAGEASGRGV